MSDFVQCTRIVTLNIIPVQNSILQVEYIHNYWTKFDFYMNNDSSNDYHRLSFTITFYNHFKDEYSSKSFHLHWGTFKSAITKSLKYKS